MTSITIEVDLNEFDDDDIISYLECNDYVVMTTGERETLENADRLFDQLSDEKIIELLDRRGVKIIRTNSGDDYCIRIGKHAEIGQGCVTVAVWEV